MGTSLWTSTLAISMIGCALQAPDVSGLTLDGGQSLGSGGSSTPAGSGGSDHPGTGGTDAAGAGGAGTGGSGTGGAMPGAGGSEMGGSGGAGGGVVSVPDAGSEAATMTNLNDVAMALNGLRIDDTCASDPGAATTCQHVMNPYHAFKSATIAGATGTTYNVVVHIRGVTEPTIINGGTKPDAAHPQFNLGGTPGDPTYQPWFISISSPAATYYLNNFGFTNHTIHGIDWQETIPVAAGATVTLDVKDGNDHEITNVSAAGGPITNAGVPGSKNAGQYMQIDVVSVAVK